MLIATLLREDGRKALVIGLRDEDIQQLVGSGRLEISLDDPRLEIPAFEGWDLWALGTAATIEFASRYEAEVHNANGAE